MSPLGFVFIFKCNSHFCLDHHGVYTYAAHLSKFYHVLHDKKTDVEQNFDNFHWQPWTYSGSEFSYGSWTKPVVFEQTEEKTRKNKKKTYFGFHGH